jgi:hypothetical protein
MEPDPVQKTGLIVLEFEKNVIKQESKGSNMEEPGSNPYLKNLRIKSKMSKPDLRLSLNRRTVQHW